MSDEDDPTLTGADVFGDPVPGEAVTPKDVTRPLGRPRPRFRRRADGRPYPLDARPEPLEDELPDECCPD